MATFACVAWALGGGAAHAGERWARVLRPAPGAPRLQELGWASDSFEVEINARSEAVAKLEGTFSRADWSLLWDNDKALTDLEPGEGGRFKLEVPLHQAISPVHFVAVGPRGETSDEAFEVRVAEWGKVQEEIRKRGPLAAAAPPGRPWTVTPSLGLSQIAYSETGVPDFSETALTGKLSGSWKFGASPWEAGASAYLTLLPLATSGVSATARFLGLNLRGGYAIPAVRTPWRLSVQAGYYYTTMLVSNDAFGFYGMNGPQLYPVLSRALAGGGSVSGYFKYSPVASKLSLLSLASRELAFGASFAFAPRHGRVFAVTADVASLKLGFGTIATSSFSFTLGASYGL